MNISRIHLINLTILSGQVSKIKEDLKQCASSGRDLNTCLTDLAVAIKPYMKTGVPDLGIPRADPLILDQIAFDLQNPIIDVHVEFTDNEVTGERCKTCLNDCIKFFVVVNVRIV